MRLFLIPVAFSIFLSADIVNSAENKVGQPLLCHGCVAVLKELHKTLRDSSGSKKAVSQSLGRLCQINNFVSYTFSPPKMIKACNYIVENHKKELSANLIEFYRKYKTDDNLLLQEKFCDHVINACEGVRRPTKESEMKPHGFSVADANEKLQNMAEKGFEKLESNPEAVLETPLTHTTPVPHEEL